jgi:mevalonate kinase
MPVQAAIATAPGKVILFGEHAVVYGRPAIAVPVTNVVATATVEPAAQGSGVEILAADLAAPGEGVGGYRYRLRDAAIDDPLRAAVELTLAALSGRYTTIEHSGESSSEPDILLTIASTIPIARGLGSGAAVATAVARALSRYFGHSPQPDEISRLVYEVEKLHHGTPSGVDNTVIAFEQPVYFIKGKDMKRLSVGAPLNLIIADTGVTSSTREVVGDVRRRWQSQPDDYEGLFDEIGAVVRLAKTAIEQGTGKETGRLMDQNHDLLKTLGVSCFDLDRLVREARAAGALGAKMSGAGWGGNMVALIQPEDVQAVASALREAGAVNIITSQIS